MNVLIIRLSSMGDVILATSLFSALKQNHPSADITFVTWSIYAGLFEADTRLSRVVRVEKGAEQEAAQQLAGISWDCIIDLQNNNRSRRILAGIRSAQPISYFNKLHAKRLLLLFLRINRYRRDETVRQRYLRAGGIDVGAGQGPYPSLIIDKDQSASVPFNSAGRPSLGLFPFSAWKNKQWPLHYFGEVGRYFAQRNWNILIFGGPEDSEEASKLTPLIGPQAFVFTGKLALHENVQLIQKCDCALGNDTGLSHMARACGVKTAVMYGATSWHWGFFPEGDPEYRIIEHPFRCRPCHAHGGNVCLRFGSRACLQSIGPQKVIRELESLASRSPIAGGTSQT